MQIIKNVTRIISGTTNSTTYGGKKMHPEAEAFEIMLKEHVRDLAHTILLNDTGYVDPNNPDIRFSHGLINAIRHNGGYYHEMGFDADQDGFSQFLYDWGDCDTGTSDYLDDNGVLHSFASRNIIGWLKRLGQGSMTSNTFANNPHLRGIVAIDSVSRPFMFGDEQSGENVTLDLGDYVVMIHREPMLEDPMYNKLVLFPNFEHIEYQVLSGNGVPRDQVVTKNIQNNTEDGFRHMILTEAGLKINFIESSAILDFSNSATGNNFASNYNY
jgi:hypothetical protein